MVACTRPSAFSEDEKGGGEYCFVAVTAIVTHILTVLIQLGFLILLLLTSIEHREDPFETSSGLAAETELLVTAVSSNARLDKANAVEKKVEDLCYRDDTIPGVHYVIIFIWITRMVPEIQNALWTTRAMCQLWVSKQTTICTTSGGKQLITAATTRARAAIFLFCPIFRVIIALVCSWAGAKLLALRNSSLELVARMVVMTFIVDLDEMIWGVAVS